MISMIRRTLPILFALALVGGLTVGCGGGDDGGAGGTGGDATSTADGTGGTPGTDNGGTGGTPGTDTGGVTNPGVDTGGNPGTGTDNGTGTCVPQCEGRACGPDGCGGQCGFCPPGQTCGPLATCVVAETGDPFGSACEMTEECAALEPADFSDQAGVLAWLNCVNQQCEGSDCNVVFGEPVCTRTCTLDANSDQKNNATGANGGDGVEDEDAPVRLCDGAVDGPYGTDFRCVRVTNPNAGDQDFSQCIAGTNFNPCTSNADCPSGESCQVMSIVGVTATFCAKAINDGKGVSEFCESNPHEPSAFYNDEVAFCESGLCFINGIGCSGACTSDADCNADGAPWNCMADFEIAENSPVDICFPNICEVNGDCGNDDFFCRTFRGENDDDDNPTWEHLCLRKPADAVAVGEACDDDPFDNNPGDTCENPIWCVSGQCSTHCNDDTHCGGSQSCGWLEFPIDDDEDDVDEALLPLGICQPVPPAGAECTTDSSCAQGEGCVSILKRKEDSTFEAKFQCAPPASLAATGVHGDQCGNETGVSCVNGNCLNLFTNPQTGDPIGVCLDVCSTWRDCPQVDAVGEEPAQRNVCRSILLSQNTTLGSRVDDLYLPVCLPAGAGDALVECKTETAGVADPGQCGANTACFAFPISVNPGSAATTEFVCLDTTDADNVAPTGAAGSTCDPEGEDNPCASQLCVEFADGSGLCSHFCDPSDADSCSDVAGTSCQADVLLPRAGDDESAVAFTCLPTEQNCLPCFSNDFDCGDGFVCANTGGNVEDFRCIPSCGLAGTCLGGGTCEDVTDSVGGEGRGCVSAGQCQ